MDSLGDLKDIVSSHHNYRSRCLNMCAAEVPTSPTIREFLTIDFGYRYGTYYDDPLKRNYFGCKYIAQLEVEVQEVAKEIFKAEFVDFRPLGGEMAGCAVICGLTKPNDTIFEMGDGYGQKIATKFLSSSLTDGLLKVEYWPMDFETDQIDVDSASKMIREKKPKLLIFGRSQILFSPEPVSELKDVANEVGAYIAYDASHVFGLMAGKRFFNPLKDGADVLMGSHTKSFPGPQGGMILTKEEEPFRRVRKGLYPTLVCNHHLYRIPTLAAALLEMKEFGEAYADQVIKNSKKLGEALTDLGFEVLYPKLGFSETHMILVDFSRFGKGTKAVSLLEKANIICNEAIIPKDIIQRSNEPSGARIGTQESTRIGMKEEEMEEIATFYKRVLIDEENPIKISKEVSEFKSTFNKLDFSFDEKVDPYKI